MGSKASCATAWPFVVTAFALSACGGGDKASGTPAVASVAAAPAPAPAPVPAPAPAPVPAPAPAPAPAAPAATLSDAEQLVPAWARNYVPRVEIYVSPTGNDASSGLSRAAALKTTAAAIGKLAPGVRLNFTAGTYGCSGAFIAHFNGGMTLPGSIRSVDGPRAAKFDCANADGSAGGSFLLDFVRGFIFEGIELSNTVGHGIQVMSGGGPTWDVNTVSSDIVVHASYIHHTGLAGMKSSQSRRISVINNELAYVAAHRQTLEFVAVDQVTIAGNEAHHSGYFNEIKGGAHGPHVIFGNYIHDSDGGILVGGPGTGHQFLIHTDADFEARDLKVWNNVIVNVPREAFYVWACHDCVVAHTTYYGAAPNASFRMLPSNFTDAGGAVVRTVHNSNVSIQNNLFLSGAGFNDMVIGPASETTGLVMNHNLWFANGLGTTAGVYSDIPFAGEPASLYSSNPLLTGAPVSMRPAAGSPVIGKGIAMPFATNNFDGLAWNGAPNIGAY